MLLLCSVEAQSAALHAGGLDAIARGMLFADSRAVDIYMLQAAASAPVSAAAVNSTAAAAAGGTAAAAGTAANASMRGAQAGPHKQRACYTLSVYYAVWDAGAPSYNAVRAGLGLAPAQSFEQISGMVYTAVVRCVPLAAELPTAAYEVQYTCSSGSCSVTQCLVTNGDALAAAILHTAYNGNITALDFLVGGLAEGQQGGTQSPPIGFLFRAILTDQFVRLKQSDPLWTDRALMSRNPDPLGAFNGSLAYPHGAGLKLVVVLAVVDCTTKLLVTCIHTAEVYALCCKVVSVILMTAAITCCSCTVNCSGHGLDDLLYTSGITAQRYTIDNAIQREAQHVHCCAVMTARDATCAATCCLLLPQLYSICSSSASALIVDTASRH
eukprot:9959-Heterococcus_DN1.PRE.2